MTNHVRESLAAYGEGPRLMTVDEYYRAAEKGIFDSDEKLELIHGQVFRMSQQKSRHAATTSMIAEALRKAFPGSYVREHMPLGLDKYNEPEPDVLVVKGPISQYVEKHPNATEVLLAVEVSETSLRKDRQIKTELYASFGIAEYWIVNLVKKQLEVYREPRQGEPKALYAVSQVHLLEQDVKPILSKEPPIRVRELIPE